NLKTGRRHLCSTVEPRRSMGMTLEKVLLAPVPDEQLTKAQAVCQREGTVAFPSNVWSLSSDVHGGMSILFYASSSAKAPDVANLDDQSRCPSATWLGSFVRYVSTVQGDQREARRIQATTTAEDRSEQIVGFYEVASLEQLSEQRWVAIERLRDPA